MAQVKRFTIPGAFSAGIDVFIPGAGIFFRGVLDVAAGDSSALAAVRAAAPGAVETGPLDDSTTPPPTPTGDPYPEYLKYSEFVASVEGGSDQLALSLKAALVARPSGGTDGQALVKQGTDIVWGAGGGGGSGITAGTVVGQIPVWDGDSYEPQTPADAVATDIPFTPTGTVAATNVQAAIAEVAAEALPATQKGAASGVATLDSGSHVPVAQLGSGSAASGKYLDGTGAWTALPGSGGGGGQVVYLASGLYSTTPHGSRSTLAAGLNRMYLFPVFPDPAGPNIDALAVEITTAATAGGIVRVGIYERLTPASNTVTLVAETSTTIDATTIGLKTATFTTSIDPTGRNLFLAAVSQVAACTFRSFANAPLGIPMTDPSGATATNATRADSISGALPTTPTLVDAGSATTPIVWMRAA